MGPAPMQVPASDDPAGKRLHRWSSWRAGASTPGATAAGPPRTTSSSPGGSGHRPSRLRRRRPARHLRGDGGRARRATQPVFHKNALYKNLGGWKFKDVSKEAGVDAAAWGNGVCAGDFDDDGKIDLYVTNFGPNFLFRNNGNGTFTEMAAKAGVQAGGWSTGCAFFDAKGDGKLDLYVARYVSTSWEEVLGRPSARSPGGAGPRPWSAPWACPERPISSSRTRGMGPSSRPRDAHGLKDSAKGLRLRGPGHRLRRRRLRGPLRGQRHHSQLPLPQPGRRDLRERGPPERGGRERGRPGPGRHGGRLRRLRRRRPPGPGS